MKTKLHCAVLALVHNVLQKQGAAERRTKVCPMCKRSGQTLQAVHERGHEVGKTVASALAGIKALGDVEAAINSAIKEASQHIVGFWCPRCHHEFDHPPTCEFDDTFDNWLEMHPGKTYDDFLRSPEGRP